ncbi:MAG TPA: hypothetical protein VGD67_08340 [Pseudonocardiaceae bacterium]
MTAARPVDRPHDRPLDDRCVADVSERLMIEYEADLPLGTVTSVVLDAHRDLAGQIPPTALAEMLERLARYRLDRLLAAAG